MDVECSNRRCGVQPLDAGSQGTRSRTSLLGRLTGAADHGSSPTAGATAVSPGSNPGDANTPRATTEMIENATKKI